MCCTSSTRISLILAAVALTASACGSQPSASHLNAVQEVCDRIFVADSSTTSPEEFLAMLVRGEAVADAAAADEDVYRTLAAGFDGAVRALNSGDSTRYLEESMLIASECTDFMSGAKP